MSMDFGRGHRAKRGLEMNELNGVGIGFNSDSVLVIRLPDLRVLLIISRSLFLVLIIVALPFIGSIVRDSSSSLDDDAIESSDLVGFRSMPLVFNDLLAEGLLKKGNKGLIVSSGVDGLDEISQFLNDHGIDLVVDSGLGLQSSISGEAFDFVFAPSSKGAKFIDRILKIDGIMIMQLTDDSLNIIKQQGNFKIVYVHQFDSMVVAMRKTNALGGAGNPKTTRRLLVIKDADRKGALKGLEDVLLEPPRKALANSINRKIKFLPNLLGNSLEPYDRRVFITDNDNGVVDWFYNHYPTRNRNFETFNLEIEIDDKEKMRPFANGISNWLRKNVKEEDYVVMKAEAVVVEEMIMEKTIFLVDELFLECRNQWEDDGEKMNSKRAYWQCLELYGRLRDDGVAVHQWWN